MSTAVKQTDAWAFVIHLGPMLKNISEDEFFEFCQLNRDWRTERTSDGEIVFMPPTGGEAGSRNFDLIVSFGEWARADGTGKGFDSSTGFTLPNGAVRSPDLAWVSLSRWNRLTGKERERFAPICPEFVVELRSESDSLALLKEKMKEYIDNGAQLAWLIDPLDKKAYVYRPQGGVECLDNPTALSGEPLLPGFVLDVRELFA
jgi:Uma2 family endonuclease